MKKINQFNSNIQNSINQIKKVKDSNLKKLIGDALRESLEIYFKKIIFKNQYEQRKMLEENIKLMKTDLNLSVQKELQNIKLQHFSPQKQVIKDTLKSELEIEKSNKKLSTIEQFTEQRQQFSKNFTFKSQKINQKDIIQKYNQIKIFNEYTKIPKIQISNKIIKKKKHNLLSRQVFKWKDIKKIKKIQLSLNSI